MQSDHYSAHGPVGLILAAGASSRMHTPKALLKLKDGSTLVRRQMTTLLEGGCDRVFVVTGCHHEQIAAEIPKDVLIYNPDWAQGRITSIRAGLAARSSLEGYLILPVDTAGISMATVQQVLRKENRHTHAVRPYYKGTKGFVAWISTSLAVELKNDRTIARADEYFHPHETRIDVDDAAIVNNINTPLDWDLFLCH